MAVLDALTFAVSDRNMKIVRGHAQVKGNRCKSCAVPPLSMRVSPKAKAGH